MGESTGPAGLEHVRFQQTYAAIPVTAAEIIVHLRGASLTGVNAKTWPSGLDLNPVPRISREEATARALNLLEQALRLSEPTLSEPRLEFFNRGIFHSIPSRPVLAWFLEGRQADRREFIWIDARSGSVLLHFNQVPNARCRNIYTAQNEVFLPGRLVRRETDPPISDPDVTAAFDYTGDFYDFLQAQGRDSYDGNGAPLLVTVHYSVSYMNAFWDGVQTVFGDQFCADDVVAHEWTHALIDHSARLFYYMQPGSLNESFADIFGETVDLLNGAGNDSPGVRWLNGEDTPTGGHRNLMNPGEFEQPGRTGDGFFKCYDSAAADQGGVHVNSSVLSHAFALMVDGKTYNSIPIQGIGLEKSARLMYLALTGYLTPASNFVDAYYAILQAGGDMVVAGEMSSHDLGEVKKALDAVELAEPLLCSPMPAAVPDLVPPGLTPLSVFSDGLEDINSGLWAPHTISGAQNHWTGGVGSGTLYWSDFPAEGSYHFWGYNLSDIADSAVEMTRDITPPPGSRLQFRHCFGFHNDEFRYFDGGVVEYSTDAGVTWKDAGELIVGGMAYVGVISGAGNPLRGRMGFVANSYGYTATQLDLSSLANRPVRFRFRMGTNEPGAELGLADYGWFIDDIRFYQAVAPFTLTVVRAGSGSGEVTSQPGGIQCGGNCSWTFTPGAQVSLHPTPGPDSVFVGWEGACSGAGTCALRMDEPQFAVAVFAPLDCSVTLSATTVTFPAAGGSATVSLSAPPGCPWTASIDSTSTWIALSESQGNGPGIIHLQVGPNPHSGRRKGVVRIENQELTVVQDSAPAWRSLGPEGGVIYSMAISRSNPLIIYLATGVGIFKSENGGNAWKLASPPDLLINARALAVDPNDPLVVYASGSEGFFKSTDGGDSWFHAEQGLASRYYAQSLVIDANEPSRLYLGSTGIFTSQDGGAHWQAATTYYESVVSSIAIHPTDSQILYAAASDRGVLKSTDRGWNWSQSYRETLGPSGNAVIVAVDPTDPSIVFAGLNPGIVRSTDSGASWAKITSAPPSVVTSFLFDPSDPSIIQASTLGAGIYTSSDRGLTWARSASQPQAQFIRQLLRKPGGQTSTICAATQGAGVLESLGEGEWRPRNNGLLALPVRSMVTDPKRPDSLLVGADGGFFRSDDGGASWENLNSGLTNLDVVSLAIDPQNSDILYLLTYGGDLFKSQDAGRHWQILSNIPDGYWASKILVDASNSNHLVASARNLLRSKDGGQSWKAAIGAYYGGQVLFQPDDPSIMYASRTFDGFYRSEDGGETWKTFNKVLPLLVYSTSLGADPFRGGAIYMGTGWGEVGRSFDGGQTWLFSGIGLPDWPVTELVVDKRRKLYAAVSSSGVFVSHDSGATWASLNEGLPDPYVVSLALDQARQGILYAGTQMGVLRYDEPPECNATVDPPGALFSSAGGIGAVAVSVDSACAWSARSTVSWIAIASPPLPGEQVLTYRVAPNPDTQAREGALILAGWSFSVSQAGSILSLSPLTLPEAVAGRTYSQTLAAVGAVGAVAYRIQSGRLPSGLTLSSSGILTGAPFRAGQFAFSVEVADASGARSGRDYVITVNEACQFTLSSTGFMFPPDGGSGQLEIHAHDGCPWTATRSPENNWLQLTSPASGSGPGAVTFSVGTNTGGQSRAASLTVAGHLVVVHQRGETRWRSVGPDIARVRTLAADTVDRDVVYAGTGTGIFKSEDRGVTWTPLTPATRASVSQVLISPHGHRTVYAAGFNGLWKTTDAGVTWSKVGNGIWHEDSLDTIAIHPTDPNLMFAAGSNTYRTTDGGEHWDRVKDDITWIKWPSIVFDPNNPDCIYWGGSSGLVRSTDRGISWQRLNWYEVTDLAMPPGDPGVLYVATQKGITTAPGIWKFRDGVQVAQQPSGLPGTDALRVAVSPTDPNLVLAAFAWSAYRSTDAGLTWNYVTSGPFTWESSALAVDPWDDHLIYAGSEQGLLRSQDRGLTWTLSNSGLLSSRLYTIRVSPEDPNTLFAGTSGEGLLRSRDGGVSWQKILYADEVRSVFALAFDPKDPNIIYAGTPIGPLLSYDEGSTWYTLYRFDRQFNVPIRSISVDPSDPSRVYVGTESYGVCFTDTNGLTWYACTPDLLDCPVVAVLTDPIDSRLVYAGSGKGVYRSTDRGLTWRAANLGLSDLRVNSLTIDERDPSRLYAGTLSGVFASSDRGSTWTLTGAPASDPSVTALCLDPGDQGRIFAGTLTQGVYQSSDGGSSWAPFNDGLTDLRVTCLEMSPNSPSTLYAGTDWSGIFRNGLMEISGQGLSLPVSPQGFDACGGYREFQVSATVSYKWTVGVDADWVKVLSDSENQGAGVVRCLVAQNTTGQARGATLFVGDKLLSLLQGGGDCSCEYSLPTEYVAFRSASAEVGLPVVSWGDCSFEPPTSLAPWIRVGLRVSETGTELHVTVEMNQDDESREGAVVFGNRAINVTQAAREAPGRPREQTSKR